MGEYTLGKDCHLLLPLDGEFDGNFYYAMRSMNKSASISPSHFHTFLASESQNQLEEKMGLSVLETKAYVSKFDPAIIPFPFGLVLEGDVRVYHSKRSYGRLNGAGEFTLPIAHEHATDLDTLMTQWYECALHPETSNDHLRWRPHFNEAIIKSGSCVVGAYHDQKIIGEGVSNANILRDEYGQFLAHVAALDLPLYEIRMCHL